MSVDTVNQDALLEGPEWGDAPEAPQASETFYALRVVSIDSDQVVKLAAGDTGTIVAAMRQARKALRAATGQFTLGLHSITDEFEVIDSVASLTGDAETVAFVLGKHASRLNPNKPGPRGAKSGDTGETEDIAE